MSELKPDQICPVHHSTNCCGRRMSETDSLRKEIERLEAENKSSDITIEKLGDFSRTLLERSERLEAENRVEKDWAENKIKEIKGLKAELSAEKAKVERLRGALGKIKRMNRGMSYGIEFENIAEEALQESQNEK